MLRCHRILYVALFAATYCAGAPADQGDHQELTRRLIATLEDDNAAWSQASAAVFSLPQIAPSDADAQEATIRFLKRLSNNGGMVPVCYARALRKFDASFAARLVTVMEKPGNSHLHRLSLTTIALMGDKARGVSLSLKAYLLRQSDPGEQTRVRIALAAIGANMDENALAIEKSILRRRWSALDAVEMGALIGFGDWASDKAVAEVRHWLDGDVSADYKFPAAIALAVSGRCDKSCRMRIETLLADERHNTGGSTLCIGYAYALALADDDNADKWWQIILETLAKHPNHTDGYALDMMLVSLPLKQMDSIRRVCRNSDPAVASAAGEFLKGLDIADICGAQGPKPQADEDASGKHKNEP